MRVAVVAFCAAAVLCAGASASKSSRFGWPAAKSSRKLNVDACWNAIAGIDLCVQTYQSGAGDGEAIMANCCPKVNDLMACGPDVWVITDQIMAHGTGDNLQAIGNAMTVLNWCPRTGTSAEDCSAKKNTRNQCLAWTPASGSGSSGSSAAPDCCAAIKDEIPACLGQSTGSAVDHDAYWTDLEAAWSDLPECQPFSSSSCANAASFLNSCYQAANVVGSTVTYDNCCLPNNFYTMFCTHQSPDVWGSNIPNDETFWAAMAQCNSNNNGGSGSYHGSGSGSYNGPYCDWSRQAPGFQWYSTGEGGFVITNNMALSTNGVAVYSDPMQSWYQADYAKVPGLSKLYPIDASCYSFRP